MANYFEFVLLLFYIKLITIGVNAPDVCTEQPHNNSSTFCDYHAKVATEKGYPTDLRGFLKFCGVHKLAGIVLLHKNSSQCTVHRFKTIMNALTITLQA